MNESTLRGTTTAAQLDPANRSRRWRRFGPKWLAIGLVVMALAAGCSGSHQGTPSSASAPQAPATKGKPMTFQLALASAAPVSAFVPDQPIGEAPTSVPGITLQVYAVKRMPPKGVVVVFALQISAAVEHDDPILSLEDGLTWGGYEAGDTVSGVGLLDTAGLKLYQPYMVDPKDASTCLCSNLQSIPSSTNQVEHAYLAAVVAAPPASVSTVSFVTQMGTIPNLPIS